MKVGKFGLMVGVLMVMLLAAACVPIQPPTAGGSDGAASQANPVLEGSSWMLTDLADESGALVAVPEGVEVTLAFAEGSASGSAGCNRYVASYTVEGQSGLTFGPAATTMMACMGPGADIEPTYLAMLANVTGFESAMGVLTLWNADQNIVASYTAVVPVELVGTNWNALSVNNGRQGVETVAEGTSITAVFGEDGILSGKACNNYSAGYTVDGNNITIEMGISTMMACPNEAEMAQEQAYLMMLPQAATYAIDGDMMELRTADGALIASYVAE